VTYLAVMGRPLLRAMFTGDVEVLGELAGESAGQLLRKLKIDLADELFELLRDRGLMRTDLDAETQRYVLNAVQAGFYLYPPAAAPSVSTQMAAAALAHVVRHAVQPPGPPDTGMLAALAGGRGLGGQTRRRAVRHRTARRHVRAVGCRHRLLHRRAVHRPTRGDQ
jgi:hypothetical protein